MNRSLFVIKPEAMPVRDKIRKLIVHTGLKIVRTVEVVIPAATLDLLYTDLSPDLRRATQLFMGREPCEIGEVSGENAVKLLLAACGDSTDPSQCDRQTIRAIFGVRQAEHVGNAAYFKNAIHRPKTVEEAHRDLLVFSPLLTQTVDALSGRVTDGKIGKPNST